MTAQLDPEAAELLCRDGITAVELHGEGASPRDVIDLLGDERAVQGIVLYVHLLEWTVLTLYAAAGAPRDVSDVRTAAATTASAWRHTGTESA